MNKYYFLGCGKNKCKILSQSNNKKEATEEVIDNFGTDLIDYVIYLVTIKKIEKTEYTPYNKVLIITEYKILKNLKLKDVSSSINNQLFTNKKIEETDILKFVFDYVHGNLKKGLMEKNVL